MAVCSGDCFVAISVRRDRSGDTTTLGRPANAAHVERKRKEAN
jgi:hypothetical protein